MLNNSTTFLLKRTVPADNSCLFTSVYFVVENGKLDLDCQKSLRELIARTVSADKETFNEGILNRTNAEYCNWIRNPRTWGGSIELMILSKYFKVEICVIDTQAGLLHRFGEDKKYSTRVFITYNGVHFDPLYALPSPYTSQIQTRFSSNDKRILQKAIEMAQEYKEKQMYSLTQLARRRGQSISRNRTNWD